MKVTGIFYDTPEASGVNIDDIATTSDVVTQDEEGNAVHTVTVLNQKDEVIYGPIQVGEGFILKTQAID